MAIFNSTKTVISAAYLNTTSFFSRFRMEAMLRPQQLKKLLWFLSSVITAFSWTPMASAEWTEWLLDSEIAYTFQDNINHTVFETAELSDHAWNGLVSAGRIYQLTALSRFFVSATIDGEIHEEFDKLNQFSTGVSVALRHKFGIGPDRPWIRGSVDTSHIFSSSRIRDGQLTTAGIDVGKRVHQRLEITLSYRFDYRNSHGPRNIDNQLLIDAGIEPGKSSSVFDLSGHSLGIQFNTLLTEQWLLMLAYEYRDGDIVSSNNPGLVPGITSIVDAIAFDDALPGWAYRADAQTHRYSVDANYAFLKGHAAVNVGYDYVESFAGPFTYRNNLFRLNLLYSF